MADLPDRFPCTITNWDYIYDLCRDVADQVKADEFEPDVVVALARGGWFAGRCLCDFIGLDDLTSLKMEHYVGTAETGEEPTIRYPLPDGAVAGKNVLVIDDVADTGGSIMHANEYVRDRDPDAVRTATLQLMTESAFEPDYVGESLDEWAWIVYPWNFLEDMVDLVSGIIAVEDLDRVTEPVVRSLLEEYHEIERIHLEVAQPDRIEEVLEEMTRRGHLERTNDGVWRPTG